ncbi:hypothetical protein Peur_048300 [Populus x canadensis]
MWLSQIRIQFLLAIWPLHSPIASQASLATLGFGFRPADEEIISYFLMISSNKRWMVLILLLTMSS